MDVKLKEHVRMKGKERNNVFSEEINIALREYYGFELEEKEEKKDEE